MILKEIHSSLVRKRTPQSYSELFTGDWVTDIAHPKHMAVSKAIEAMLTDMERRMSDVDARVDATTWDGFIQFLLHGGFEEANKMMTEITEAHMHNIVGRLRIGLAPSILRHLFEGPWVRVPKCEHSQWVVSEIEKLLKRLKGKTISRDDPDWAAIENECTKRRSQRRRDGLNLDVAQAAYNIQFQSHPTYLISYLEYVAKLIELWVKDEDKKYFSMYHCVLNGSGMGKTRMLTEVIKQLCLGIYINVSYTMETIPRPNTEVREWLLSQGGPDNGNLAELHIESFIVATVRYAEKWLKDIGKDLGEIDDHPQLFAKWYEHQVAEGTQCWVEILKIQEEEKDRLSLVARLSAIADGSDPLASGHARAQLLSYRDNEGPVFSSKRPTEISATAWEAKQVGGPDWLKALKHEYNLRMSKFLTSIDELLWDSKRGIFKVETNFIRVKNQLLASWKNEPYWPTLLFILDESRSLLVDESGTSPKVQSVFDVICSVGQDLPRQPATMSFALTDTTSRLSDFAPGGRPNSISQTKNASESLFEPFCDIQSIDVFPAKDARLSDVLNIFELSKYGRVALHASISQTQTDQQKRDYIKLLRSKMKAADDTVEATGTALVAVLGFLVVFHVFAHTALAHELLASHMLKCLSVSKDQTSVNLQTVCEPLMAMAAYQEIERFGWSRLICRLNERGITDMNCGAQGEVCGQIAVLMAYREAVQDSPVAKNDLTVVPVPLLNFLERLGVRKEYINSGGELLTTWEDFLKNSFVRVSQFTSSHSEPTQAFFRGRFARAGGIVCRPNYPGVDGFLPLLMTQTGLLSPNDVEMELTDDCFSFVGLQYKNNNTPQSQANYERWSGPDMNSDKVLGYAKLLWDNKVRYVSVLIEFGRPRENVKVDIRENGPQLSITIRGLKPSHILRPKGTEESASSKSVKELDEAFSQLLVAMEDRADHYKMISTHSFGDKFHTRPQKIADLVLPLFYDQAQKLLEEIQYFFDNDRHGKEDSREVFRQLINESSSLHQQARTGDLAYSKLFKYSDWIGKLRAYQIEQTAEGNHAADQMVEQPPRKKGKLLP